MISADVVEIPRIERQHRRNSDVRIFDDGAKHCVDEAERASPMGSHDRPIRPLPICGIIEEQRIGTPDQCVESGQDPQPLDEPGVHRLVENRPGQDDGQRIQQALHALRRSVASVSFGAEREEVAGVHQQPAIAHDRASLRVFFIAGTIPESLPGSAPPAPDDIAPAHLPIVHPDDVDSRPLVECDRPANVVLQRFEQIPFVGISQHCDARTTFLRTEIVEPGIYPLVISWTLRAR